jgi:hypothetical protein
VRGSRHGTPADPGLLPAQLPRRRVQPSGPSPCDAAVTKRLGQQMLPHLLLTPRPSRDPHPQHTHFLHHVGDPGLLPCTAPEEEDTATRLSTPCGAAVTIRLAQKMLADYCGKLPGADR